MDRVKELLIKDKFTSPQVVAEVLKEEILPVANNFFLLSEEPVVRFRREGDRFVFNVEIQASRIKPFGNKLF